MQDFGLRSAEVRLAEIMALFALGQDNAFGQPMGAQLGSCVLASGLAEEMALPAADRDAIYWVSLLRYIGCTGHAHEVAAVFGDDIDTRARSVSRDMSDPRDLLPEIFGHAGSGAAGLRRVQAVLAILAGGRQFVTMNFRTGCEVGDALLERLGMSDAVRDALQHTFEQWNGKGFPNGVRGPVIPLPMRLVRMCHDAAALDRLHGHAEMLEIVRRRSGRLYDPDLVAAFTAVGDELLTHLDKLDPWDAALALEPQPLATLVGEDLDRALVVAADFIDLKSPFTAGHSRGVAELAATAAQGIGMEQIDVIAVRRAGWVHDFGRTAIPNSVWDKVEPLTRADVDRIELHPILTEQMLRRCAGLAGVATIASQHHERIDGSGYAKGLDVAAQPMSARVLAVADRYHDLIEDRAYRPALSGEHAAAEIRRRVSDGKFDPDAAHAVLQAAGHSVRSRARSSHPAGLTDREIEVLRLAVQGLTLRAIASRLGITAKTADAHVQHIYAKTGVSTRGALALFAVERGLVPAQPPTR